MMLDRKAVREWVAGYPECDVKMQSIEYLKTALDELDAADKRIAGLEAKLDAIMAMYRTPEAQEDDNGD